MAHTESACVLNAVGRHDRTVNKQEGSNMLKQISGELRENSALVAEAACIGCSVAAAHARLQFRCWSRHGSYGLLRDVGHPKADLRFVCVEIECVPYTVDTTVYGTPQKNKVSVS